MPLKKCYECNKEISTKAATCPHCGAPQGQEYEKEKLKELLEMEAPHVTARSQSRVAQKQKQQKKQMMSLKTCKECGHEVSSTAKKCLNCGAATTLGAIQTLGCLLFCGGFIISAVVILFAFC